MKCTVSDQRIVHLNSPLTTEVKHNYTPNTLYNMYSYESIFNEISFKVLQSSFLQCLEHMSRVTKIKTREKQETVIISI